MDSNYEPPLETQMESKYVNYYMIFSGAQIPHVTLRREVERPMPVVLEAEERSDLSWR